MKDIMKIDNSAVLTEEERRKMRRNALIKIGAMGIFVLVVLIFSSIAWFTMNKENSASGMGVRVGAGAFELGVKSSLTNVGIKSYTYDDEEKTYSSGTELNSIAGLRIGDGSPADTYDVAGGAEGETVTLYHTGASADNIKWRLTGNVSESGLGPDSGGTLDFYIIPTQTGSLDVSFSLTLDGYTAVETKNANGSYEITSVTKVPSGQNTDASHALNYLNSHILFFADIEDDNVHYKQLIDPSSFTLSEIKGSTVNATANEVIPVTIYWEWVNTFGQMVLSKTDNPANKEPITIDDDTMEDIKAYVLNPATTSSIFKDVTNPISLMTKNGEFDVDTTVDNIKDLSLGYNKADQDVGINLDYVLVSLKAS